MKMMHYVALSILCLWAAQARGQSVTGTYTDVAESTTIDLTATGNLDWVKWGNGESSGSMVWTTVRKASVPPIIGSTLTPLGTPPTGTTIVLIAFSGQDNLNFDWADGDIPMSGAADTVITETILPAQFDYPLGLGASFTATATAATRILDVYVQGFNADMMITAQLSSGVSASTVVSPTQHPTSDPSNNYSLGRYRITYAGAGETLTVSVHTVAPAQPGSVGFPNAGFFAAAVSDPSLVCDVDASGQFSLRDAIEFFLACRRGTATFLCDLNDDGIFTFGDVVAFFQACRLGSGRR